MHEPLEISLQVGSILRRKAAKERRRKVWAFVYLAVILSIFLFLAFGVGR